MTKAEESRVPSFSVALCTCNGEAYLPEQLNSILRQIRPPDEVLIFDDASTDKTPDQVRAFIANLPFPVRFSVNRNRLGTRRNFEQAFALAQGDWIFPCDQDDVWYPDKLQRFEQAIESHPEALLVFSDADLIDSRSRPIGNQLWRSIGFNPRRPLRYPVGQLFSTLVRFNVVTGAAMAFNARSRTQSLPIPVGWVHDGWLSAVLSNLGACIAIDKPLLAYRQHDRQQIGAGPSTLSKKVAVAHAMDARYFDQLADNYRELLRRLELESDPSGIDLIRDKVAHCLKRADLRRNRLSKFSTIAGELFQGSYHRCSIGFLSALQDLFLR